jgi:hypothetical protein
VVVAAGPSSPMVAKAWASRLCAFLAGPCGWDRVSTPLLEALLSPSGIGVHLSRREATGVSASTRAAGASALVALANLTTAIGPAVADELVALGVVSFFGANHFGRAPGHIRANSQLSRGGAIWLFGDFAGFAHFPRPLELTNPRRAHDSQGRAGVRQLCATTSEIRRTGRVGRGQFHLSTRCGVRRSTRRRTSDDADLVGLRALRALCHVVLDSLVLIERTVAVALDC